MGCDVCGAYAHPYLSACPGCGSPLESRFPTVLKEWIARDHPRSRDEAEAVAISLWQSWDDFSGDEKDDIIRLVQAESAWEARCSLVRSMATSQDDEDVLLIARTRAAEAVGSIELRYFGGSPGHPSETDVRVVLGRDLLRLIGPSGSIIASIPVVYIVAAVEFDAETSLGWYGISFGNVISFATPKINTSGWLVTFATQGTMHQFAVGARRGLFSKKPLPGFFRNAHMAMWGHPAVDAAEADLGPIEYARSLGLKPAEV